MRWAQASPMRMANPGGDLDHHLDGFVDLKPGASADEGLEVGPDDVLHHDEVSLGLGAEVVNGDNVGVDEIGCRACLLEEAGLESDMPDQIFAQELGGDLALEIQIARAQDLGHTSRTKLTQDLVSSAEIGRFLR